MEVSVIMQPKPKAVRLITRTETLIIPDITKPNLITVFIIHCLKIKQRTVEEVNRRAMVLLRCVGIMDGPSKFCSARKIRLPLEMLAKF